jgi:hypothetical protein
MAIPYGSIHYLGRTMKTRHKSDHCLNCEHPLKHEENYCPACGQENNEVKIGFGQLVVEFLSNYLALDSRIGRSIFPFLMKPGFLTTEFNRGKRKSYLNPVRLYLVMSIFYFFIMSLMVGRIAEKDQGIIKINTEGLEAFSNADQATRETLYNTLSEETLNKLEALDSLDRAKMKDTLLSVLSSTEMEELEVIFGKQLQNLSLEQKFDRDSSSNKNSEASPLMLELNQGSINFGQLNEFKNDLSLSDQEVVDSISTGELSGFENRVALQMVKLARARSEAVLQIIVNNFPVMMLVLIPLFAGILKLMFLGSGRLYIEHIIHGLHLHAFAYFSYGVFLLILLIPAVQANWGEEVSILGFILVTGYAFRPFQKVYRGKWTVKLIKFTAVGLIYVLAIFVFFILEVLISLYLF